MLPPLFFVSRLSHGNTLICRVQRLTGLVQGELQPEYYCAVQDDASGGSTMLPPWKLCSAKRFFQLAYPASDRCSTVDAHRRLNA